jgi:hypothetical protein
MFIPDPVFSNPDPGRRVDKIPDPRSGSAHKNSYIFNPKTLSMLLKKLSGMFIPDLDFFPIPDPGVKKASDPGFATLLGTMLAFINPYPATKLNPDRIRNTALRIRSTVENRTGLHGSGTRNKTESGLDTEHWCYD